MADVRVAATLASLPRAVRLVAFDFDLCVLRVHSFGLRLEAADVAARDLGRDFVDLVFFVDLVRALVAALGASPSVTTAAPLPAGRA